MSMPIGYVVIDGNVITRIDKRDVEMYANAGRTIYRQVYEEVTDIEAEIESIREAMQQ